ncbi:hypothetical protein A1O3_09471 [Capronia epimyces CBS 606.96]|uniref:Uncharacterized protein n=1 Tax=Capronia epimyces CBS 606.96 TaxID=1182542 RepID=W9XLV4_9EURO|nr:uncharacterized protein A1O3_09471 [Capronia epimyces CBS 606.96]EXJ78310.1 hypothetical protein A1O3_09471 [Capronia epimyces CBS 606.96]
MIHARRAVVCLALGTLVGLLVYYRSASASITVESLRSTVPQVVGLGDYFNAGENDAHPGNGATSQPVYPYASRPPADARPSESVGSVIPTSEPPGANYTRSLVMARTKKENVDWLEEVDLGPEITQLVYVADDPTAPLHTPKNKGHEVMVYLTYIIDHYDDLPDVSIFMHAHRYTWHNDDLLNFDAAEMIKRLSSERVQRQGYMNLRCHWMPGCPEWIHPGQIEEDREKLEQSLMADAWAELFPLKPIPTVLAQPCCSQFALSRSRIRELPRERYLHLRDWLLRSQIRDTMSGRIFEYLWQVIFTGESSFCPNQRTCYCDGFGVCFESDETFDKWFEIRYNMRNAEKELREWEDKAKEIEKYRKDGKLQGIEAGDLQVPEFGKKEELATLIRDLGADLEYRRLEAIQRGIDAKIRAESDGRAWKEGDGF